MGAVCSDAARCDGGAVDAGCGVPLVTNGGDQDGEYLETEKRHAQGEGPRDPVPQASAEQDDEHGDSYHGDKMGDEQLPFRSSQGAVRGVFLTRGRGGRRGWAEWLAVFIERLREMRAGFPTPACRSRGQSVMSRRRSSHASWCGHAALSSTAGAAVRAQGAVPVGGSSEQSGAMSAAVAPAEPWRWPPRRGR